MLTIKIPSIQLYDEGQERFIMSKEYEIRLEHSLVSLSKWEAKWKTSFLGKTEKTNEQVLDYIRCMTITQNVDPNAYSLIPRNVMDQISDYISDPMTATTFSEGKEKPNNTIVTSELIYYWMIVFQIPWEAQTWHLNRLLTLIKICSIKNTPAKKMKQSEVRKQQREINAARKAKYNTSG